MMNVGRPTAELCDAYADRLQVCEPLFQSYGGLTTMSGAVSTVRCFEDNSRVKEAVESPGQGRILVVDGGGSRRHSLFGGNLANTAVKNGWVGVIVYGCIRDSAELALIKLALRALGTMPLRSEKRGEGERDVPVRFGGVTFRPGDYVYADEDGIVVAREPLA